jgi:acyl carrier protein
MSDQLNPQKVLSLMDDSERILAAIYRAIDWINEELPAERKVVKAPETRLLGPESVLDSMRLVTLIVTTEREIEDGFGVALTLADERALSMKASPFRSIKSLADYIAGLITKTTNA